MDKVTMVRGDKEVVVSRRAFDRVWSKQGWAEKEEQGDQQDEEPRQHDQAMYSEQSEQAVSGVSDEPTTQG